MKLIDRYIIKNFLGTFFYTIALLNLIVIVFDISEKIDDFIEKNASLYGIFFEYYIYFIPYFANLFSPLFIFIAVIFFTSRMASRTEITAILSSGVSFWRMMVPYMVAASILASISVVLNNFIIPPANAKRLQFEWTYVNNPYHFSGKDVHAQTSPGEFIYFKAFNVQRKIAYEFTFEKFDEGKLKFKLMSDHIKWDSTINKWHVRNYYIREIDGFDETIKKGVEMDTTFKNFHPEDYSQRSAIIETLNYFELNDYIADQKAKGNHIETFLVEKYKRFSLPFATFILTLIGVSLSSRKVRGGIGLHIALGFLLSFTYILFMQVANTYATSGGVPVLIAVWTPNILFGILSLFLIRLAPK